jgi:hypothetical protein
MGIDMRIMGTDVPNMGTVAAAALVRFHHHLLRRRLLPRCALTARALHPVAIPGRHSPPERAKTFFRKGKHHRILHCNFFFPRFVIFFLFCHVIINHLNRSLLFFASFAFLGVSDLCAISFL